MVETILISMPLDKLKELITETVTDAINTVSDSHQDPYSGYPELLTRNQVSEMLGICLATVDNWTKNGRLKKVRNGHVVRYKKSEIIESFKSYGKHQRA